MKTSLTGRFYHKKTWLGLVLMVEINYTKYESYGGYVISKEDTKYIKATEEHIQLLNLKVT